jgi:hypothetical protein
MPHTLTTPLTGVPLPLAGGALLLAALLAVAGARIRKGGWLADIGPQAAVALGGLAVSVHGLWAFADHTAHLPIPLRAGLIGVFDAAEMTLLVMLYREADPERGWTPELRLMHRTAWMLVAFSAAMNAVDAPNWWARIVLGCIPPLTTWLIELRLRTKLRGAETHADEARPGPARLLLLLWRHAWAALFAALGLDARASTDIARAALAQRAASQVYRLRLALELEKAIADRGAIAQRWAKRRVGRLRRLAQKAIDRADIGTDPRQSLAMARRLTALTRADDVALLDYSDARGVMAMLDGLAVTAEVEALDASQRAAEAESARQRAEAARQEAERARLEAEEVKRRAQAEAEAEREQQRRAEEAARRAAAELKTARQEAERAAGARLEAETARQRAADDMAAKQTRAGELETRVAEAEARLEQARQQAALLEQNSAGAEHLKARLVTLQGELDKVRGEQAEALSAAREAQRRTDEARRDLEELQRAHSGLVTAANEAEARRDTAAAQAADATRALADLQARTREAEGLLSRLREQVAEHVPEGAAQEGEPSFKSAEKTAGWELYLTAVRAEAGEPAARDLAERFGINEGNARNWIRDFRAAHAAQLAARQPSGAARSRALNGHPVAS